MAMTGGTQAATYSVGVVSQVPYVESHMAAPGIFSDRYDFSIATLGTGAISVTNVPLYLGFTPLLNIGSLSLDVFDAANNLLYSGTNISGAVTPGSYHAQVTGTATGVSGGAYAIALAATPVPLPPALWLLASGLTGLAALARRRRI